MTGMREKLKIIQRYVVAFLLILVMIHPDFRVNASDILERSICILTLAMSLTFLVTLLFKFLAKKWNRRYEGRDPFRKDKQSGAALGGLAIYLSMLGTYLIYAVMSYQAIALLCAGAIVLAAGLLADTGIIRPRTMVFGQILSCMILIFSGAHLKFLPSGFFSVCIEYSLTIAWILGITNALNFFDQRDGLVLGSAAIMAFFLGIVAIQTNQYTLSGMSAVLFGCCIGFIPYNAGNKGYKIALGNSGGTLLGFMLASFAVLGGCGQGSPIKAFLPTFFVFAYLIFELVYILLSSLLSEHPSVFQPWTKIIGADFVHQRLEAFGMSERQAVLFIFLFEICLGSEALLLCKIEPINALFLLAQAAGMIAILAMIKKSVGKKGQRRQPSIT